MTSVRVIFFIAVLAAVVLPVSAQEEAPKTRPQLDFIGGVEYERTGDFNGTNGTVRYGDTVLRADRITGNDKTGDIAAEGHVRLMHRELTWVGDSIRYNYLTRKLEASQFRTGKAPVFTEGEMLGARNKEGEPDNNLTNKIYTAENAYITTDDNSRPFEKLRARSITIIPGERIIARDATLYLGGMPVFYFPYYSRRMDLMANHVDFVPGYRSRYGAYLLSGYNWYLNEHADGVFHLDYRTRRGFGGGPDVNLHLNRWGELGLKYYFLHDNDPNVVSNIFDLPQDRQRFLLGYNSTPWTNLNLHFKSRVSYEGDERVLHDFFESDFRANPQASTFVEATKLWDNFSLDVYAQPRINQFFNTIERLPDVRLTGFRQQIGDTPFFYESETSAGWYRRRFAETNDVPTGLDYEAERADTFHQITMPKTFFGWLNFTPRVGGRFTHYGSVDGPGGTNDSQGRFVFNTGAELSFKASRTDAGVTNRLFALDGVRHIVEPSANYIYVPTPRKKPAELQPFDHELPSLRLLPVEFPDYNAVDSIDSQSVVRLGLKNRWQTKRDGTVQDFLNWDVYTDCRLDARDDQTDFADIYSDMVFRPRNWLTLESQTRYDVENERWRMAFHNLTFHPGDRWSWSIGHWYLRDDLTVSPLALGQGSDLVTSTFFYRLDENWGWRAHHQFNARDGELQEQDYTIYRDMRSWTAGLTFRRRESQGEATDYSVAITFSLKAAPRYGVGDDIAKPTQLLGY